MDVFVRFVIVSIHEVFANVCDKYQNVVCWPISILFVYCFGAEVFGFGTCEGTGEGLNLERLILVVV